MKLYIPPPPPAAVLRTRRLERPDEGVRVSTGVISAPPGFVKTTLRPAALQSLDEEDRDLTRLLFKRDDL